MYNIIGEKRGKKETKMESTRSRKNFIKTSETICNETVYKLTEHVPTKKSFNNLNNKDFGYYLAGLIESRGKFGITSSLIGESSSGIEIKIRKEDISYAYSLKKKIGFGKIIKSTDLQNISIYKLKIIKKEGLLTVSNLINGKLRSIDQLNQFKTFVELNQLQLQVLNLDSSPLNETYWLSGFTEGIGGFEIILSPTFDSESIIDKDITLNLRFSTQNQFDFSSIFEQLVSIFGGKIYESLEIFTAYKYIKYFDKFSLQSSKYLHYLFWRKTYLLIQKYNTPVVFVPNGTPTALNASAKDTLKIYQYSKKLNSSK